MTTPLDVEAAWPLVRETAKRLAATGETFESTKRAARYRIAKIDDDRVTINRLDANESATLSEAEVRRAVVKLNAAGGVTRRRTIDYTVAKETALVFLHPSMRWSEDGNTILVTGTDDTDLTGRDWLPEENEATVADYFSMLLDEIAGRPPNKMKHNEALRQRLRGRSKGAVEFKHQNISYVLDEQGLPTITGYKPRRNAQAELAEAVERFLDAHPEVLDAVIVGANLEPHAPPAVPPSFAEVVEEPPTPKSRGEANEPWRPGRGRKTDFAKRDASNRNLGRLGEEFVVAVEKERLGALGHTDLADRVEWISETRGDGEGFDVLSFNADGSERWIEVKTTGCGKKAPFEVTINEVRCSEAFPAMYHIYRVYDFGHAPRLYILSSAIPATCSIRATSFMATF
jgi:hypothetical protein